MDETDRAILVARAMFVAGLALLAVAQAGEHLGWWNDFGEVASVSGVGLSAIGLVAMLILGSTRSQVRRIADAVAEGNAMLQESVAMHREGNAALGDAVVLLRDIRDRL